MYNRGSYSSPTTLGISERWERVLCYALLWVSGLILLLVERENQTVRRHAAQSVTVFGVLGIVGWLLSISGNLLGAIPGVGFLFAGGFGLLGGIVGLVTFVAWIGLMVLAYFSPNTFISGPRRNRYL